MRRSVILAGTGIVAFGVILALGNRSELKSEALPPTKPKTVGSIDARSAHSIPPQSQVRQHPSLRPAEQKTLDSAYVPREVVVKFDEGVTIPISIKRPRVVNPPYRPIGKLTDQYEILAKAAIAGDGAAARMLYQELSRCSRQAAFKKMELQSGAAPHTHDSEENPDRCEDITEEQLKDPIRWARLAAEAKDYFGRQLLGAALSKTPEGFEVFNEFWLDGNISALPGLSITYATGAATGHPDFLNAYARSLIYFEIIEATRESGVSEHSGSPAYLVLKDRLRYLSGHLNSSQQREAEALAIKLLAENKNCCIGSF